LFAIQEKGRENIEKNRTDSERRKKKKTEEKKTDER